LVSVSGSTITIDMSAYGRPPAQGSVFGDATIGGSLVIQPEIVIFMVAGGLR
jgi:hypothetical protein